jgi:hypothetical protein
VFVTSQGRPYARFQRALRTGNAWHAESAARELGYVSVADAFSLLLLYRPEPERFNRAAARWLRRLTADTDGLTVGEVAAIACLLGDVGRGNDRALTSLAALLRTCGCSELAGRIRDPAPPDAGRRSGRR